MEYRSRLGLPWLVLLAIAVAHCGSSGSAGSGNKGGGSGGSGSSSGASGSGSGASGSGSGSGSGGSDGGSSSGNDSGSGSGGSGSGSGGPDAGPLPGGSQSVLQRGNDVYRRATFTQPGLTLAAVPTMAADTSFNTNATFPANGNTQNQGTASVLYLEEGPTTAGCPTGAAGCKATTRAANAGLFFAFPALTATPNVVAFDETTGLAVWTTHVTSGGDGIRGTPVIDPVSRRLFVVTGNNPHLVHALSVDTGVEVTTGGWPVTLASTTVSYKSGTTTTTFDSGAENQHGALLLVNGILYIPFGGPYGDGGSYLGWVVAVNITTPTQVAGWATQSPRSGIWGSGGLTSDGTSVFGVTGDTTSQPRATSDSEEVFRLTGLAQFTRNEANVFVPTEWQSWDKPTGDLDFGASTSTYVPLPAGSTPAELLLAPAKAGRLFVLDAADLSGGKYPTPGGFLGEYVVASTTAESVYTSPTVYTSASGIHVAINVGSSPANCPAGTPTSSEMIVSMLLHPGQDPIATEVWCSPNGGGGHTNYPPISTTTDGVSANAVVWFVDGAQLRAVDGETGKLLLTTTGAACDDIPSMSYAIAARNRIVISALGHLCSWSVDGQ